MSPSREHTAPAPTGQKILAQGWSVLGPTLGDESISTFPSPQPAGGFESLGKRRKEFGAAEGPAGQAHGAMRESTWPQAG